MKRNRHKKDKHFFEKFKRRRRIKEKQNHKAKDRHYSNALLEMIDIYEPDDEDWMGFKLTDGNTYTFHHIKERRTGGKEEVENGAILTRYGHQFLNHLDSHNKRAYNDYQTLFKRINKSKGPIDDDLKEDIYGNDLDWFVFDTDFGRKEEYRKIFFRSKNGDVFYDIDSAGALYDYIKTTNSNY